MRYALPLQVLIWPTGLYKFLESECGVFIAKGRRFIEAVLANETEATLLGIDRGTPLLMLDSISYVESGQPVEYYHALHRGDRSRFEVELLRSREADIKSVELEINLFKCAGHSSKRQ